MNNNICFGRIFFLSPPGGTLARMSAGGWLGEKLGQIVRGKKLAFHVDTLHHVVLLTVGNRCEDNRMNVESTIDANSFLMEITCIIQTFFKGLQSWIRLSETYQPGQVHFVSAVFLHAWHHLSSYSVLHDVRCMCLCAFARALVSNITSSYLCFFSLKFAALTLSW